MLRNVFPAAPPHDTPHLRRVDPVSLREREARLAIRLKHTHLTNLVLCHLGVAHSTPLCHHVVDVVLWGPQKQEGHTNATRCIATMQNEKFVGRRPELNLPSNTMRAQRGLPAIISTSNNLAVAFTINARRPKPTGAKVGNVCGDRSVLVNVTPEGFCEGDAYTAASETAEGRLRALRLLRGAPKCHAAPGTNTINLGSLVRSRTSARAVLSPSHVGGETNNWLGAAQARLGHRAFTDYFRHVDLQLRLTVSPVVLQRRGDLLSLPRIDGGEHG